MRDYQTTEKILGILRKLSYKYPDQRITQLILNATMCDKSSELYYKTDEELITDLTTYYNKKA